MTYEDGDTVAYGYDNNGALATVADSATGIKTTYYYDFTDRLMQYVEKGADFSHSVGYSYDMDNNLTAVSETTNGVTRTTGYAYDDDNRVTAVTAGGSTKSYSYDAYGRVTTKTVSINGTPLLTETFTYVSPSATATSSQVHTHTVSFGSFNKTYTYTYDDNGNILSIQEGNAPLLVYAYDSANQLIREDNYYYMGSVSWAYDNAGNIISCSHGELGSTPDFVSTYSYNDSTWGDLYTSYPSDAIGNMTEGMYEYTWEHGRQLASAYDYLSTRWDYTYNADGIRTQRTNGTTTYKYVYNGSQLTGMTVGSNVLYFTYDDAGRPFMLNLNGVDYYYVTNLQGDVMAVIDTDGQVQAYYAYDAWGCPQNIFASSLIGSLNPLLYRGYVYDQETGLYYLNSRYYDPSLKRFISPDAFVSTGQGLLGNNMFAYCNNNPVNYSDSSGFAPFPTIVAQSDGRTGLSLVGLTGPYNELRKLTTGMSEYEVHHLVEKRFYDVPGVGVYKKNPNQAPSVILQKQTHKGYTSSARSQFKYGTNYHTLAPDTIRSFYMHEYGGRIDWIDLVVSCFE